METTPFFVGAAGSMEQQLQRLVAFKTAAAILQEQYLQQQQQREEFVQEISACEAVSFRVEDLLDFPPQESGVEEDAVVFTPSTSSPQSQSPSPFQTPLQHKYKQEDVAAAFPYAQKDENGLSAPPDELADQLEWLSAFHEDSSYSCDSALVSIVTKCSDNTSSPQSILEPIPDSDCLTTAIANSNCLLAAIANFEDSTAGSALVPSRARSKRVCCNTGPRAWDILIPMAEDNSVFVSGSGSDLRADRASDSIATARGSAWWRQSSTSPLLPQRRASKKGKKIGFSRSSADGSPPRRCSHCLVQKTPQWRTGPLGPKTLCNACGVRYKSGRLVPEYRPASSPSFVSDMHSNSHRRILEMRRMKEAEVQAIQGSDTSTGCANQVETERCHAQTMITSCMTSSSRSLLSLKASDVGEGEEHNSVAVCSEGMGSLTRTLVTNGTWREDNEESINSSPSAQSVPIRLPHSQASGYQ